MMRITGQHWTVAFSVALIAHAGVAVAVLWESPPSGAQSAGLGGLEVSLGPVGGAPGAAAANAPLPDLEPEVEAQAAAESVEPPEAVKQEAPKETATDTPEPLPETPPETEATTPPEPTEMAEAIEPPIDAPDILEQTAEPIVPEPVEQSKPPEAEAVTPVEVAAAEPEPDIDPPPPQRKPKPTPVVPPATVVKPVPAPKAEAPQRLTLTKLAAPTKQQIAKSVPSVAGAGGKAGSEASPDAGSADQVSGGGLPGHAADYMALLQAWLHKHKEYPYRARARRQEGTAMLYFVMDRNGRVMDCRIQESSGFKLLDEEVLALIRRAEPLPPPPPEMAGNNIKLVVPVQFFLQ